MVATEVILVIALYIIVILILWRILKTFVKAILYVSLLTIVALGIIGYLVVLDAQNFKEGASKGVLVVYHINENVVTGFDSENNEATVLTQAQKATLQSQLTSDNLEGALQDRYKMFVVKEGALGDLDLSLPSPVTSVPDFTSDQVRQVLTQGTDGVVAEHPDLNALPDGQLELFFASQAFAVHIINDPLVLIEQFKEDNLVVYPETAMFKVFRYIPLGVIKASTLKLFQKQGSDEIEVSRLE